MIFTTVNYINMLSDRDVTFATVIYINMIWDRFNSPKRIRNNVLSIHFALSLLQIIASLEWDTFFTNGCHGEQDRNTVLLWPPINNTESCMVLHQHHVPRHKENMSQLLVQSCGK